MYNLLNIYDCPHCGKRLSDEVENINTQVADDEWCHIPFCNVCKSEVKIRMHVDPETKQEVYHYEEVDEERARWAHGFYDETEDEEDHNWTCKVCGGEFWDGGTSCTCQDWENDEPTIPPVKIEKYGDDRDLLPF